MARQTVIYGLYAPRFARRWKAQRCFVCGGGFGKHQAACWAKMLAAAGIAPAALQEGCYAAHYPRPTGWRTASSSENPSNVSEVISDPTTEEALRQRLQLVMKRESSVSKRWDCAVEPSLPATSIQAGRLRTT